MTNDARYRMSVASRVLAAAAGGYVLTSLIVTALCLSLPGDPATVVLSATMASFLVWAAIVMAVFHARSVLRAWMWLAGTAAPLALFAWLLLPGPRT